MTVAPRWQLPLHVAAVTLTFAATTLAWIVFRSADLGSAGRVLGDFFGLGHSSVVSFSPLAAAALLLLGLIVWGMPNAIQLMWRHDPALPSPYASEPVVPAPRFGWQPTRLQAGLYGLICILAVLALSNLNPFIYFQF